MALSGLQWFGIILGLIGLIIGIIFTIVLIHDKSSGQNTSGWTWALMIIGYILFIIGIIILVVGKPKPKQTLEEYVYRQI